MENDIHIQEVQQYNTLKEEKLQKMKNNIEALQINIAKKKLNAKQNTSQKYAEPTTIYEQPSIEIRNKSPSHQQQLDNQYGYNSTLFKNLTNESQPLLTNGSAVSNFSSVSNINNILNNQPKLANQYISHLPPQKEKDNLLDTIDKVLEKMKKTQNLPTKTLEKILENKQTKINQPFNQQQAQSTSKYNNKGQTSARNKLQDFKQRINKLDTIEEEYPIKGEKATQKRDATLIEERVPAKTFNFEDLKEIKYYQHHKKESSSFTDKSSYAMSDGFSRLPPTPPTRQTNVPINAVQRQKQLIKESMQQLKKLQTQSSHDILDKSQIDFQLSDDDETHQPSPNPNPQHIPKRQALLNQKKVLELQLQQIQEELQQLTSL